MLAMILFSAIFQKRNWPKFFASGCIYIRAV